MFGRSCGGGGLRRVTCLLFIYLFVGVFMSNVIIYRNNTQYFGSRYRRVLYCLFIHLCVYVQYFVFIICSRVDCNNQFLVTNKAQDCGVKNI